MLRAASLLLLVTGFLLAQAPGIAPAQVDKIFAKWDTPTSPGCALSVIKNGRIVYKRGYGMADLDHDIPITPATVFHIASISKQFTATAILLLAQDGKLSLDDDIRKYLPDLPDLHARITIAHLIHHTSGLRDQWDLLGLAGWRYSLDLITDDDVLELMSRQTELNFAPGDKHVYCNTGYTLLAQIVKRVSGESHRAFTTNRIFKPLGMQSTHFRDDHAEIVKHMAYGYVDGPGGNGYRLSVTNFDTVGATSLLTTVEDLALWDENFYHPRVGGPSLLEQQLKRGKLNSGKELDYASGLVHGTYRGLRTIDHGGSDAGYRADLVRFPDQHFSVACLCNKGEIFPVELTRRVADLYLAGEFKQPPPPRTAPSQNSPISPSELAQYTGIYWKKDTEQIRRVFLRDGKLFAAGLELMAISKDRFQWAVDPDVAFTFHPAAGGAPPSLAIQDAAEPPDTFDRLPELHPTANELAVYSGTYSSTEIDPLYRISVENGALLLKRSKSKPETLRPVLQDYFQGIGGVLHFSRDPSGAVTGFTLNSARVQNFHFKKTR